MESDRFGWWTLNVDGASRHTGVGLGLQLEAPTGEIIEHAIRLDFPASNNEAEYEAIIAGINVAISVSSKKKNHKKRLSIGGRAGKWRI